MSIALRYLVDRARHPRSRADEVRRVRLALVGEPGPLEAGVEEADLAAELARLRAEMSAALGEVEACRSCARGHPLPHGRFQGGHCCGGVTEELFTQDELASLRLSGTTPARLAPPPGDHAGCSFRGATGCSLDARDRPTLCVRYVCRDLEAELRARGDWDRVRALGSALRVTFARFLAARRSRSFDG